MPRPKSPSTSHTYSLFMPEGGRTQAAENALWEHTCSHDSIGDVSFSDGWIYLPPNNEASGLSFGRLPRYQQSPQFENVEGKARSRCGFMRVIWGHGPSRQVICLHLRSGVSVSITSQNATCMECCENRLRSGITSSRVVSIIVKL